MLADSQRGAARAALSFSSAPNSPPSPSSPNLRSPTWSSHRSSREGHRDDRRLSSSARYRRGSTARAADDGSSFPARAWQKVILLGEQTIRTYSRLTPLQKALAIGVVILGLVVVVLGALYSHAFFAWLAPITRSWREKRWGWLIVFLMVFATSIPPIVGYSTACTITGFVYGFPLGWPIVVAACTLGSLTAFPAGRTVLSGYVGRMVGRDARFRALGQVLRREGLLYLTAIRFCPLPFSLSNGFLATIPTITPWSFVFSTFLSSPKLLVHIFIGSQLAYLAESGDKMTLGAKLVNYLSMIFFGAVGILVGLVVYRRTMARAAEIAREEGNESDAQAAEDGLVGAGVFSYDDDAHEGHEASSLIDPEDAAALMSEDDVSLWDAPARGEYRDQNSSDESDETKSHKKSRGHSS